MTGPPTTRPGPSPEPPDPGAALDVAVHGLGYVGTVTAAVLAAKGHRVVGIDVDGAKVDQLNAGIAPVREPGLDEVVSGARRAGRLEARRHGSATIADAAAAADVHVVCVGTPSRSNGSPDTTAVTAVVDGLMAALDDTAGPHRGSAGRTRAGIGASPGNTSTGPPFPVIVIRSTVLPGTVDRLARRLDRRFGVSVGVDYGLAMCPEFLREASAVDDFLHPPFTVVGVADPRSEQVLRHLFAFTERPVLPVSVRTAESVKYACNAFHAVKVAFANEIGRVAQASGADGPAVMEILCRDEILNISAAYLRPGFAFGGSCLPKDLRAMVQHSRQLDLDLPLLSGVLPSNDAHLDHTVRLILAHRPCRVGILGLTFKSGTDDLRESPYVRVAETLIGKGIEVTIWDADLDADELRGGNRRFVDDRLPHLARLLRASADEVVAGADVCLVGTTHREVAAALARRPSVAVIDEVGCLMPEPAEVVR